MNSIRLTGRVMDWDEEDFDEATIREDEIAAYAGQDYIVALSGDFITACRPIDPADRSGGRRHTASAEERYAGKDGVLRRPC